MRLILKPIYEWLIGNYSLFEDPMKNYITMGVIGVIATTIAWYSVKSMYRDGSINGRSAGSFFYCFISFIVVTVLFVVISVVMWIIRIILSVPWWGWLVLATILAIGVYLFWYFRKKYITH